MPVVSCSSAFGEVAPHCRTEYELLHTCGSGVQKRSTSDRALCTRRCRERPRSPTFLKCHLEGGGDQVCAHVSGYPLPTILREYKSKIIQRWPQAFGTDPLNRRRPFLSRNDPLDLSKGFPFCPNPRQFIAQCRHCHLFIRAFIISLLPVPHSKSCYLPQKLNNY